MNLFLASHLHKALCSENNVRYLPMKLKEHAGSISGYFFMTTGRFDEQRHPSAAAVSPADVWTWRIWYIFVPSGAFSIKAMWIWKEVKWRAVQYGEGSWQGSVYMSFVHPGAHFEAGFVNSACLLCASGMAAEQKVCCLGVLSRLTHPHPPPTPLLS